MTEPLNALQYWNGLHRQPRFRPQYPNENVVRFLMNHFAQDARERLRALDIGIGGGRHTKLLCELGFQTFGVDISDEGLYQCRAWLHTRRLHAALQQACMAALPFASGSFDVALSIGVYYYADSRDLSCAVAELHRILAKGGRAMVVVRSVDDYRFAKGTSMGDKTFRLEIADTNEFGTVQRFLDSVDVPAVFREFAEVRFEKTETTFDERRKVNSDWLIEVRK